MTWIGTSQAAQILCVCENTIHQERGAGDFDRAVDTRLEPNAKGIRSTRYLRADVERVREIMSRVNLKLGQACRVLIALEKGLL
jgi:hypothetical protein